MKNMMVIKGILQNNNNIEEIIIRLIENGISGFDIVFYKNNIAILIDDILVTSSIVIRKEQFYNWFTRVNTNGRDIKLIKRPSELYTKIYTKEYKFLGAGKEGIAIEDVNGNVKKYSISSELKDEFEYSKKLSTFSSTVFPKVIQFDQKSNCITMEKVSGTLLEYVPNKYDKFIISLNAFNFILNAFNEHGIKIGNFNYRNIIITKDGSVKFIDNLNNESSEFVYLNTQIRRFCLIALDKIFNVDIEDYPMKLKQCKSEEDYNNLSSSDLMKSIELQINNCNSGLDSIIAKQLYKLSVNIYQRNNIDNVMNILTHITTKMVISKKVYSFGLSFDLDGTLISKGNSVEVTNFSALKNTCRKRGIPMVLSTGCSLSTVLKKSKLFPFIRDTFTIYNSVNGNAIYSDAKSVLYSNCIDYDSFTVDEKDMILEQDEHHFITEMSSHCFDSVVGINETGYTVWYPNNMNKIKSLNIILSRYFNLTNGFIHVGNGYTENENCFTGSNNFIFVATVEQTDMVIKTLRQCIVDTCANIGFNDNVSMYENKKIRIHDIHNYHEDELCTLIDNTSDEVYPVKMQKERLSLLDKKDTLFKVILDDNLGHHIGFAFISESRWDANYINIGLCINDKYRGNGICSKTLDIIKKYIIKNVSFKKYKGFLVRLSSNNIPVIKAVEKYGFKFLKYDNDSYNHDYGHDEKALLYIYDFNSFEKLIQYCYQLQEYNCTKEKMRMNTRLYIHP